MKVRVYVPRPGTAEEGWSFPVQPSAEPGGTHRVDKTPEGERRGKDKELYEG